MNLKTSLLIALAFCLAGSASKAQSTALLTDTFTENTAPWTNLGGVGIRVTHQATELPPNAKGALVFTYTVNPQKQEANNALPFQALIRPVKPGTLAALQAIRFQAYSDIGAPFICVLSEHQGGRYLQIFWLPPKTWQSITLYPKDFWLSDNKGDPPDPDGKLDLDQVEAIGIVPMNTLLTSFMSTDPQMVGLLQPSSGQYTFRLADFEALSNIAAAPPPKLPDDEKGVWIDPLNEEIIHWLLIGSQEMQYDLHPPFPGHAIAVHYQQGPARLILLLHDLHRVAMENTDRIVFQAAAEKGVRLAVSLQMKDGARYFQLVDIPGDSKPTTVSVNIAAMQPEPDSQEALNHPIDTGQLTTLILADVSFLFGQPEQQNTIWIGPVRAVQQTIGPRTSK
ncbi:hypothetical protein [Chthonomonas calidirosea]|uniref:hypothetical protein n=1 Tax=Chthonomonas calidirosea TaxID=454171 RepID=UPI0006ECC585|nr:hypothetical protein [Chthonomonas calidirosea]CEK13501.1 hypothetical protein CP488_00520 [Chthonomonas calidirosea]